MTGSVMEGEDLVRESFSEAYRKLDQFENSRPLKPWFFRIAQNRCLDFLRRRGVRDEAETMAADPETAKATEPVALGVFELSVQISRAWLKPRRGTAIMEY
jgi:RNA polymerase sigma-70 factor (ECF subfamily)